MMRIAVFGASGQVGVETLAAASGLPDVDIIAIGRNQADLTVEGAADAVLRQCRPDTVINAAAWTAVDEAESEKATAFRINAGAAGEIAAGALAIGAHLIHISTDYVFAGDDDAPLTESAPTNPLNVYGASKLEGEVQVANAHPTAVILRTSWVYSPYGANFVKTMLRLAETRDTLSVVADQHGGPTPARAIAQACLAIAQQRSGPGGVYHFQGAPAANWAEFADAVFQAANKSVTVTPIATSDYPTPAKRPLYTVLDCSKINRDYGLPQPGWRRDLAKTVRTLQKHK